VHRQRIGADGEAGMAAFLGEYLDHQIRGAVDHLRLLAKAVRAVDEAAQLDTAHDAVEIALAGGLEMREDIEAADAGAGLALFGGEILADLALPFQLAVDERHLARDEDEIARLHERHIV